MTSGAAPGGVTARRSTARAGRRARSGQGSPVTPSLREERKLLRAGHTWLAGMDEVGRGALAGPVTVGVVVVDAATRSAPSGVRDSKLLTPAARVALAPKLRRWAPAHAVGHAEPEEIDRIGIIAALRLAAWRALAALPVRPDCVLLDGSHNWLSPPSAGPGAPPDAPTLFDLPACPAPPDVAATVVTRVKADLRCAAVAAASVLAKVERDSIMVARAADHPAYGWELNKGYAAPEHIDALRQFGVSVQHRQSWSLPGLGGAVSGELMLPLEALAALEASEASEASGLDLLEVEAFEGDLEGEDHGLEGEDHGLEGEDDDGVGVPG